MEWFHHRGDLAEYIAHLETGGAPMWEQGHPDYQGPIEDDAEDTP